MERTSIGFGYNPLDSENHFYVIVPEGHNEPIMIYERFHWDSEEQILRNEDILKLMFPRNLWRGLDTAVRDEFNKRNTTDSHFILGGTPLSLSLGKELMILLWGLEGNDISQIPKALGNWMDMKPEIRWCLYDMTNSSSGNINDRMGCRAALKYILCVNPNMEEEFLMYDPSLLDGERLPLRIQYDMIYTEDNLADIMAVALDDAIDWCSSIEIKDLGSSVDLKYTIHEHQILEYGGVYRMHLKDGNTFLLTKEKLLRGIKHYMRTPIRGGIVNIADGDPEIDYRRLNRSVVDAILQYAVFGDQKYA